MSSTYLLLRRDAKGTSHAGASYRGASELLNAQDCVKVAGSEESHDRVAMRTTTKVKRTRFSIIEGVNEKSEL